MLKKLLKKAAGALGSVAVIGGGVLIDMLRSTEAFGESK